MWIACALILQKKSMRKPGAIKLWFRIQEEQKSVLMTENTAYPQALLPFIPTSLN